ncbi:hypothetical protein QW131_06295 [Roseibium salinum]|nr:hypothetical protein [Roseibium salinum]
MGPGNRNAGHSGTKKIDAQEAASLSLSLSLGGVTREVIAKLGDNPEEPEEAMALLQNVAIENAKIRLDDASLTGRILDQEAEKKPVSRSRTTCPG